jgi:hypothetical protein
MVNVGEDLDRAEALLAKLAQALSEGKGFLDLDKI